MVPTNPPHVINSVVWTSICDDVRISGVNGATSRGTRAHLLEADIELMLSEVETDLPCSDPEALTATKIAFLLVIFRASCRVGSPLAEELRRYFDVAYRHDL